jgi:DNA-binding FadR family transcriptional regulator
LALAADDQHALLADWAFMAAVIDAAGNLVLQLIMNSVRELYLPHATKFAAVVAERGLLAPLYRQAAAAIRDGDGEGAAAALGSLAAAQEARMLESLDG